MGRQRTRVRGHALHLFRGGVVALLVFLPLLVGFGDPESSPVFSSPDEIKAEFETVPCKNGDRQAAVKAFFERMGALETEIKVEKFGGVENVVVRKAGATPDTIVIGAHYDKVLRGCGAIDNWTGIVALAHLYHSLRNLETQKSLVFVAFGREEEGMVGSKAMARAMKKEQLARVCAMINLDSFGMGAAQAATNISSGKMIELARNMAERMQITFASASISGADSDSSSFIAYKVPAITLHGMAPDWPKVLHSENDRPAAVKPGSVYLGYRLALAMIVEINNSPPGAWR